MKHGNNGKAINNNKVKFQSVGIFSIPVIEKMTVR